MFYNFYSNVLSTLHLKLEFKALLGPIEWQRLVAQENVNTVTAVCSKEGAGRIASGAK